MLSGWIKSKGNIIKELQLRTQLLGLMIKKFDKNKIFTRKDQKVVNDLIEESNIENKELRKDMREIAKNMVDNEDE